MVNWDPAAKTVLSNEEVIHNDENGHLYYIKYQVEGTSDYITIATTRPETILGDSAVAVHPEDERYTQFHGKNVIVPLINRSIPIIADDYVEMEFGTGALKVTPAHDMNDYEIGKRHNLETIDIFNDDGTLNDAAQLYIGEDRFIVRKRIYKDLDAAQHIAKREDYRHSVGRSERSNAVVEPRLSLQWYVRMGDLAKPALNAVMTDEIEFFPKKQKNIYSHWMENVRDWCVSRQLWWGQRIPAYYEKALEEARAMMNNPHLQMDDLRQDDDVLDTWFSSWLWPMSVFGTIDSNEELDYYYPTNVLVTGWDIIFLWVARMAIAGIKWKDQRPFRDVYFTGMVRDLKGRKMSKSLGNSPDALELIDTYGADGVRFGMMLSSPAGGDLLFDEKLCEQGKNFSNKIWNGLNFLQSRTVSSRVDPAPSDDLAYQWFRHTLYSKVAQINKLYTEYKLSEILITLYKLFRDDYFGQYVEMIKPSGAEPISEKTFDQAKELFELLLTMLHPFMPFITEEIYHQLDDRKIGDDLIISAYPEELDYNEDVINAGNLSNEITSRIRELRNKHGMKRAATVHLKMATSDRVKQLMDIDGWSDLLTKMAILSELEVVDEDPQGLHSFVIDTDQFFVDLGIVMNVEAELAKLTEELVYQKGFVKSIENKLNNERFVANAPEAIVANERKKLADGVARISLIEESISALSI
ncbi:UNVERIFIED_CONTAM: hypothetical protein GTU68_025687 [Idotea baltica]|nr:hypothetical protein [Idotea baltica]